MVLSKQQPLANNKTKVKLMTMLFLTHNDNATSTAGSDNVRILVK